MLRIVEPSHKNINLLVESSAVIKTESKNDFDHKRVHKTLSGVGESVTVRVKRHCCKRYRNTNFKCML